MSKLHELIAVQKDLSNQATACMTELQTTFTSKHHLFSKKLITFLPNSEGAQEKTEEQSEINSTVAKELRWIAGKLVPKMDVGYQMDIANTFAKADIVLDDDTVLAKDVPATNLLQLEKTCADIMAFLKQVPTLDPAKGFTPDTDQGEGIYKARTVEKIRTQTQPKVVSLAPPTKEHKEQVQLVTENVPVGTIREQGWSSLISIKDKGDMLDRIEELARAVKKARSRANEREIDVAAEKIGAKLLTYVFAPVTKLG